MKAIFLVAGATKAFRRTVVLIGLDFVNSDVEVWNLSRFIGEVFTVRRMALSPAHNGHPVVGNCSSNLGGTYNEYELQFFLGSRPKSV